MLDLKNEGIAKIMVLGTIITTLVLTPWMNKDSLVIPKMITFFALSCFLLPFILSSNLYLRKTKLVKVLFIIETLLFIFGILVLINSDSPIDQLLFGRTGRGLGFFIFISCIILTLAAAIYMKTLHLKLLLKSIFFAGLITSLYSCVQYFGLDIFKWDSRTNGIIGTLGNPNSQASFAAATFIPALVLSWTSKIRKLIYPLIIIVFAFTIYISQSTQGYIGIFASILAIGLIYFWYVRKSFFWALSLITSFFGTVSLLGILGHGPLSYYLYKVSVQSRGDFWRSAFTTGNSHPIFGVGFDSFGDYSLTYRDEIAASHSFAEYTDSAHNFYLDYLATGGYIFLFLHVFLVLFSLRGFYILQKNYGSYDKYVVALFCAWLVIQLQTIINTQTLTFLMWNSLLSGAVIGMASETTNRISSKIPSFRIRKVSFITYTQGLVMIVISLVVMYPHFNNDRLFTQAANTGNGDLLIQAVTSYPQTVTRYSDSSRALLESGLPAPALFLAQKGVEFNPRSSNLWGLIMVNPSASLQERMFAKKMILSLDPLNREIKDYEVK